MLGTTLDSPRWRKRLRVMTKEPGFSGYRLDLSDAYIFRGPARELDLDFKPMLLAVAYEQ